MKNFFKFVLFSTFLVLTTGALYAQGPRSTRPSITSISPTSGPAGTLVTIDGFNFIDATVVKIKTLSVPFTVVDSFTITFVIPAGATSGNISVQNPSGKDNGGRFTIVPPLPQPPTITSFSPTSDSVGYTVTITGTNFDNATAVSLNGTSVTFTIVDSVTIEFVVPPGATSGPIRVTNPDGTATSSTNFTVLVPYVPQPPTITSFTPSSGFVGTTVTVNGTNFSTATSVTLNGSSVTFTIVSNTQITFVVPNGATSGVIEVTNPDGAAVSTTAYTVTVPTFPPTITSISPTSGLVGTTVTITGTNLSTVTSVSLNGTPVTYTIVSGTSITFVVPVGATSGIVSVINPDGSANGPSFTVTVPTFPPTITSISPTSGPVGTTVTITGTNFSTVSSVKLNNVGVSYTIVSATSITFAVPTGGTTGVVSVTNPDGTANGPTYTVTTVSNLPTITRGAYMVGPMSSSITIQWRTGTASNSEVRYGTTSSSLTNVVNDATSVTDHTIKLAGLTPNTKYFYSVGVIGTPIQSGANNYFYTAPLDTNTQMMRFWVTGDFGNNSTNQRNVLAAFNNYNVDAITPTRGWIWLGDNAYSNGTDAEYTTNVFNVYGNLFNKLPLFPELGNHDYGQTGYLSSTSRGTTAPYFNIFAIPTNSGTEKYYSIDYGNVHFIGLDSYGSYNSLTSPMYSWLQNDLANNKLPWVVVYWHHPPYTKGSHNSDTEIELIDMRTNIVPLLEQWGVDLVLGGHSHIYERSKFIKDHFGLESTFDNNLWPIGNVVQNATNNYTKTSLRGEGTIYTVCGVSGQAGGSTASGYPHNAMQVSTTSNNGSLILDVNDNTLNCKFLTTAGTIFDQFTITKTIAAPRLSNENTSYEEFYYDMNGRYLGNKYNELPFNQLIIVKYQSDDGPRYRKIVKTY